MQTRVRIVDLEWRGGMIKTGRITTHRPAPLQGDHEAEWKG